MASTSEVGHAKNVANFHDLISFCQGYGTSYNPSKGSLKVGSLQALEATAQNSLAAVIPLRTAYNDAVNARMQEFNGIKQLSTRLINALQSTNASSEKVADAKIYNKKIQGGRASAPQTPVTPDAPAPNTISASQQSYDQIIQHFTGLLSVLQSEPTYTPNETDLKLTNLNTKLAALIQTNQDISDAYTTVDNSRISRNDILYNDQTGLVNTANEVKKYVKSIFGATSPQYKQISGIKITKPKM